MYPENLVGYSFIIKGNSGEGKKTTFLILPSSAPPGWAEEFSYPFVVKLGLSWHYGKLFQVSAQ